MHLHSFATSAAFRWISQGLFAVCTAVFAFGATAQPVVSGHEAYAQNGARSQMAAQGVSMHLGYNSKYQRAMLAYETPTLWGHGFKDDWGELGLSIELGAAYWEAKNSTEPDSMWQFSAVPILRWWPAEHYYLEIGTGPSMISRTDFAGRELSTRLQFSSHLGIGMLLGESHRIGIRYTHVSNASIKKPNPGLDLLEASYTFHF